MLTDAKFLPLREMESFTEDMFNRIIAFQEQEHPAWNQALSFDERIIGLPLHNFIFSNPNRNPETSGPTLAHYYPLREENRKLAHYIKQIGKNAKVCDVYPGNGIIGSLLAKEGVDVFGLTQNDVLPCQIDKFLDSNCYQLIDKPLADVDCNVIFASWIPSDVNPTPAFLEKSPDLLIYVYTDHVDESSKKQQVGSKEMLMPLSDEYNLIDQWSVTRSKDILHAIWPDMTPSIEETRHTHIYLKNNFSSLRKYDSGHEKFDGYDWETELLMTTLALEAKHLIETGKISLPKW